MSTGCCICTPSSYPNNNIPLSNLSENGRVLSDGMASYCGTHSATNGDVSMDSTNDTMHRNSPAGLSPLTNGSSSSSSANGHATVNGHHPQKSNGVHTDCKTNGNAKTNGAKSFSSFESTSSFAQVSNSTSQVFSQSNCDASQTGISSTSKSFLLTSATIVALLAALSTTSLYTWISQSPFSQLIILCLCLFALYNWRWCYMALCTAPRDIVAGYRYGKILFNVGRAQRNNMTVSGIFAENVKRHPGKVCFYFEEEVWTFKDVDEMSNRVANYFASQGYKKGDCVALFLENKPMYVCLWLGLSKLGVVPALINFHLRLQPLKHSINVADSKAVVFGHEISDAIKDVISMGLDPKKIKLFSIGHGKNEIMPNAVDLDIEISNASITAPLLTEKLNFSDKLVYIFTSGTTGLPKAAVIKHSRFLFFTMGIHYFVGVSNDEVIYDPLPLYHTAGGMIGVGQALVHGCTTVIRKKFSASSYFKDCAKYKCTAAQYIGELCRYLLCQPPSATDTQHQVKLMFGNGLRPQIWETFTKRFNIKRISEFYGATEGNCNIINIDNRLGSVGFISLIAPFIYPVTLIRIDELTGEPMRDEKTGLVLKCKPNEPGELVGKIVTNHPVREFEGYADSTATAKKVVTDVFRKGDAAFRTGDVLVMDQYGYFYFKDRTGDTFRWKGENCSTAEVEAVVSNVCGLKDAVVYGVEIPGCDGRAGMAAILDSDDALDLKGLAQGVIKSLPSYSRPLFVRRVKHMEMTGTYKMKKVELQKEGFDVTKIKDKIYMLSGQDYVPVDKELYLKIANGQMRL